MEEQEKEYENSNEFSNVPEWSAEDDTEQIIDDMFKKQKRKQKRFVATVAVCGVLGIVAVGGIFIGLSNLFNSLLNRTNHNETDSQKQKVEMVSPIELNTSMSETDHGIILTDVSQVVDHCMPSIVSITSQEIIDSGFFPWYGGSSSSVVTGAGSGIIIAQTEEELLIVTNNHVVESATSLSVQFIDESTYEAVIKGSSAENDVAVIAIPIESITNETLDAIKIATIGDSDQLKVGQGVIAIGNALGYGQSVTVGVVSALNRTVTTESYTKNMMQIDAAINGGNSGGALINAAGEVIGINSAKYSSSGSSSSASVEGMGFAIPMNDVKDLITEFMNQKTLVKVPLEERGYLGIYGASVDETVAGFKGAPKGVIISETIEGYAAHKAGLLSGDIIVGVEGKSIVSMDSLKDALAYYRAGETITITISYLDNRQYVTKDISVTLSEAPN